MFTVSDALLAQSDEFDARYCATASLWQISQKLLCGVLSVDLFKIYLKSLRSEILVGVVLWNAAFRRVIPSYWEFCSYVFSFQSLLCGPFCFYDEYIDFIEGNSTPPSSYKKTEDAVKPSASGTQVVPSDGAPGSATSSSSDLLPPPQFHPSTLWPVLKKVAAAVFLCYVHITLVPGVPLDLLTGELIYRIKMRGILSLIWFLQMKQIFRSSQLCS